MFRKPRLLRRISPKVFLSPLGAARAALLLLALLAAGGCGAFDNERVPEDFPSGARPAPIPEVDPAAAKAEAELPPAPPTEPVVEPPAEQAPGKAAAVATRPGSDAAPGHVP
jgi:hypothetical protein